MAVGSDGMGRVVDAGVEVERDAVDEAQSLLLQKGDRVLQLSVGRDLHADAHQRAGGIEAELPAQRRWDKADGVMLRAAAEKDAAVSVVIDLLGLGQAEKLGIEPLRRVDVGDE